MAAPSTVPIGTRTTPPVQTWEHIFYTRGPEKRNGSLRWPTLETMQCDPELKVALRRYRPLYWYRVELDYTYGGYRANKSIYVLDVRIWEFSDGRQRQLKTCPWAIPEYKNGSSRMVVRRDILRPFIRATGVKYVQGYYDALRAMNETYTIQMRPTNHVKQTLTLRNCQRCGGATKRDSEANVVYEVCLICSYTTYPEVKA